MIIDRKEVIKDYKSQINELFEDVYIDPENPKSLTETKINLLCKSFEGLKWGTGLMLYGILMAGFNLYFYYSGLKMGHGIFDYTNYFDYQITDILVEIGGMFFLILGLIFFSTGLKLSFCSFSSAINYLKLRKKIRKAKELKNKLKKELKNNPTASNLEMKAHLNFLRYHTDRQKIENHLQIKESKVSSIQSPSYLSSSIANKLRTKSDLWIKSRIKKNRIKNRWYIK